MRAACGGVYSASRYTSRSMVLLVIHISLVHEDRSRSDRLAVAARRASTDASSTSVGKWGQPASRLTGTSWHGGAAASSPGEQIDGERQPVVVADKSVIRLTLLVPTRTQHLRESAAMIVGCTARIARCCPRGGPPAARRTYPPTMADCGAAGGSRRPL